MIWQCCWIHQYLIILYKHQQSQVSNHPSQLLKYSQESTKRIKKEVGWASLSKNCAGLDPLSQHMQGMPVNLLNRLGGCMPPGWRFLWALERIETAELLQEKNFPEKNHWEPLNTALSCIIREERCRTWSQRHRNIYYTPESHQPSCTVCAGYQLSEKQGSSQSWKMKPVTQLHSRKGELVKTSSAATEIWIWTGNGWLLWSSAAGVQ